MSQTLTITCEHCGKQFESERKKRFCSRFCAYRHRYEDKDDRGYSGRRNPVVNDPKKCKNCGKTFIPCKKNQLYCSSQCQTNDWYRNNRSKKVYCVVCGKQIPEANGGSRYCSEQCRDKAHTKICKECGKEFVPKYNGHYDDSAQYCSVECANNAQKDKSLYVCKQCGKIFHRRKRGEDQCEFCSRECSGKYKTEHRQMTQKKFFFGFQLICKQCGNTFFSSSKTATFCSEECRLQWKSEHAAPMLIYFHECEHCGKKFESPQKTRKFCSDGCQRKSYDKKHEIRRRTRKKINGDADYSISLKRLYKRDQGICAICGEEVDMMCDPNSNEYGSIDHIIPLAKGGTHTWDNVQLAHRICNSNKRDII